MPKQCRLLIQRATIKLDDKKPARASVRFAVIRRLSLFCSPLLRRHRRGNNERSPVQVPAPSLSFSCGELIACLTDTEPRVAGKQQIDEHFRSALFDELNRSEERRVGKECRARRSVCQ